MFSPPLLQICTLHNRFKVDKYLLLRYQSKPKRPWRAADAGAFFVKFYLVTFVALGVGMTYTALTSQTFAKDCAIQDAGASLCASDYDVDTETCDLMHADSGYYDWFGDDANCAAGTYPSCVCSGSLACGAFIASPSMWGVADAGLRDVPGLGAIYAVIVDNPEVSWTIVIVLVCLRLFRGNALGIQARAAAERERGWANENAALQARVRRQARQIDKLEMQAGLLEQQSGG